MKTVDERIRIMRRECSALACELPETGECEAAIADVESAIAVLEGVALDLVHPNRTADE